MNSLSPFSGLSLIIHLLIIGVAYVVKTAIKKTGLALSVPIRLLGHWDRYRSGVLRSTSIFIIIFIAFWISLSSTVALKTGIREGALESHSEYIYRNYVYLQEVRENLGERVGLGRFAQGNVPESPYTTSQVQSIYQPISTNYTPIVTAFTIPNLGTSRGTLFPTHYNR